MPKKISRRLKANIITHFISDATNDFFWFLELFRFIQDLINWSVNEENNDTFFDIKWYLLLVATMASLTLASSATYSNTIVNRMNADDKEWLTKSIEYSHDSLAASPLDDTPDEYKEPMISHQLSCMQRAAIRLNLIDDAIGYSGPIVFCATALIRAANPSKTARLIGTAAAQTAVTAFTAYGSLSEYETHKNSILKYNEEKESQNRNIP